jgi:hypothetical protein
MTTEQVGTGPKKAVKKAKASPKAKPEKKEGPRAVPSKGAKGRTDTKGTPEKAAELVASYAKRRGWTEKQAEAYLIYVGYNRRATLERFED